MIGTTVMKELIPCQISKHSLMNILIRRLREKNTSVHIYKRTVQYSTLFEVEIYWEALVTIISVFQIFCLVFFYWKCWSSYSLIFFRFLVANCILPIFVIDAWNLPEIPIEEGEDVFMIIYNIKCMVTGFVYLRSFLILDSPVAD